MTSNFIVPLSTIIITKKNKWDTIVDELRVFMPGKSLPPGFSLHIMDMRNQKIFLFNDRGHRVFSIVPNTRCSLIRYMKRVKPSLMINISNSFSDSFTAIFANPGKHIKNFKKLESISRIVNSDIPDTEKILSFIKSLLNNEKKEAMSEKKEKSERKSKDLKTTGEKETITWIPPRSGSRKMWNHYVEMKKITDEEKKELKIFFRNIKEQKNFISIFYTRGRIEELQSHKIVYSDKTENLLRLSKTSTATVFSSSRHPMYRSLRKKGYTENNEEGKSPITTFFKYKKKRKNETKQNNFA